jgi:hypothetical protein
MLVVPAWECGQEDEANKGEDEGDDAGGGLVHALAIVKNLLTVDMETQRRL